jgi:hypothetical protein
MHRDVVVNLFGDDELTAELLLRHELEHVNVPRSDCSDGRRGAAAAWTFGSSGCGSTLAARATARLRYGGIMPTLIFVHGACVRDAAWWWSKMTEPLADHGIATAVVPLPSCGEAGETLGDLYDDVDACRQAIADADDPVVLCATPTAG